MLRSKPEARQWSVRTADVLLIVTVILLVGTDLLTTSRSAAICLLWAALDFLFCARVEHHREARLSAHLHEPLQRSGR